MVQVDPQKHTVLQVSIVLIVLMVVAAGVGFWWFLDQSNREHAAQVAAIDRQTVLGLFDTAFTDGDLERARTQALIITELYPDDPIGYLYAATAHVQIAQVRPIGVSEQLRAAEESLRTVETLDASSDELHRLLGVAYSRAGQSAVMEDSFKAAMQAARMPLLTTATYGYLLLQQGDIERANVVLQDVLAQQPEQATALLAAVEILVREEADHERVAAATEDVLQHAANHLQQARALVGLGVAEYTQKKYAQALTTFYDALEYDAENYDAKLGVLFSELGLAATAAMPHDEAFERIQSGITELSRIDPSNAQLLLAQAMLASLTNEQRARRAFLERAAEALVSPQMLVPQDVERLASFVEASLNETQLAIPPLYLSTHAPIEHCSECGK